MLFSTLTEGFLLDCRARNLSENTIAAYAAALRLLSDYLGDLPAEEVTTAKLRAYSLWLQDRGKYGAGNHPWMKETDKPLSPWSVHHYLRPVKTLFAWASTEGLLSSNPAERLRLPKLPKGRVDRFTDAQISQLLEASRALSYRDYAICFLLLDSGLRREELAKLNVTDVDLTTGLVTVKHGKGDKWRQVRVGDNCRRVLWAYVNKHRKAPDTEPALFVSETGQPERITGNALGCLFSRLSRALGYRVYAHKFRHTFATNLAKQVPNAFLVAQALGHEDLNTASIYVHLAQTEAVDVSPMDSYLKKA